MPFSTLPPQAGMVAHGLRVHSDQEQGAEKAVTRQGASQITAKVMLPDRCTLIENVLNEVPLSFLRLLENAE